MQHAAEGDLLRESRNRLLSSPVPPLRDLGSGGLDLDLYLEHPEQLHQIPEGLLQSKLDSDPRLRCPRYFPLAVRPGLTSVLIPCFPRWGQRATWTTEEVNHAMDLVLERCGSSLQRFGLIEYQDPDPLACRCDIALDWQPCTHPLPDQARLQAILRKNPDLQELQLDCNVTRETLRVLAASCHQLRRLSFVECPNLTLASMRSLVMGCPLLQILDADLQDRCVILAMKNLPHLLIITPALSFTPRLHNYLKSRGQIASSLVRPSVDLSLPRNRPHLPLVNRHFPNLKWVTVRGKSLRKCRFRSVFKLCVCDVGSQARVNHFYALLERCGHSVKHLVVEGEGDLLPFQGRVDVSRILHLCPNLSRFVALFIDFSPCEFAVTQEQVKDLRCFEVWQTPDTLACPTPPDSVLEAVICNGVLEHFQVPTVSLWLLGRLSSEARRAMLESRPSPVFPRLRLLHVHFVEQDTQIDLEQAVSLVSLAPRLERAWLNLLPGVSPEVEDFLREFRGADQVQVSEIPMDTSESESESDPEPEPPALFSGPFWPSWLRRIPPTLLTTLFWCVLYSTYLWLIS